VLPFLLAVAAASVLLVGALLKLASPSASRDALATFGLPPGAIRSVVWALTIALEATLAIGVLAGSKAAAYGAAWLCLVFAGNLGLALMRGKGGQPCGCFGARSRVAPRALLRNLVLAAAFVGVALLDRTPLSTDEWLGAGLAVALLAVCALSVAVLALARQVGELRLGVAPAAALEIPHEGPEVGSRTDLIALFAPGPRARYALAVFSSEACPVCAGVAPAVDSLARDPLLAVCTFDEVADTEVWHGLDVPGAPYAVALGLDGTVLAKGSFNTLPQLESIAATAERRDRDAARA
jgi:hypothetical protein